MDNFFSRINLNTVNSGTIESLISAGCFDTLDIKSRTFSISNLNSLMSQGLKKQLDIASGQSELFSDVLPITIAFPLCSLIFTLPLTEV